MILSKYSVLYVEDNETIAELVKDILKDIAKDVYLAKDGQDGLLKYKEHKPDIVLSDIVMPYLDGLDMAREIKKINPSQPIALVTAFENPEYLTKAIDVGVDKYIIKPISDVQLFLNTLEDLAIILQSHEKEQLFEKIYRDSKQGIMITDEDGKIVNINNSFTTITGYSKEEVIGKTPSILKSDKYDEAFYKEMWKDLKEIGFWQKELWNKRKNGELYAEHLTINTISDLHEQTKYYVAMFSDDTLQKNYYADLEHLSHYDSLTNLPNRTLLIDRLTQEMLHSIKNKKKVGVIFFGLDRFKTINDLYGKETGDKFLIEFSNKVASSINIEHTFARVGGDEFVVVLHSLEEMKGSIEALQQIISTASKEYMINSHKIQISASAGISFYPQEESVSPEQIIRQAYNSMYQAKLQGKDQYQVFDLTLDTNLKNDFQKINEIQTAIDNEEFILFYQPQVNIKKGVVVGAEALIRWEHPNGMRFPNDFLPAIEYHELSIELGDWVIKTALAQLREWDKKGINIPISVNINAIHLQNKNFFNRLKEILSDFSDVNPKMLILEILETSVLSNLGDATSMIKECREIGIEFSLDDFGTGYSSLTYLKKLPANELKIDQSFIRDMIEDSEDLAIVDAILTLAKTFQKEVVAEGVETEEHATMLLQLGSNVIQGYCISRPVRVEIFEEWYDTYIPNPHWQSIEPISRDKSSLLFAKVEHRTWLKNLENHLNDKNDNFAELHSGSCRFGKWIANDAKRIILDTDVFESIFSKHSEIHTYAKKILQHKKEGNTQKARELFELILRDKEKLFEILDSLV